MFWLLFFNYPYIIIYSLTAFMVTFLSGSRGQEVRKEKEKEEKERLLACSAQRSTDL